MGTDGTEAMVEQGSPEPLRVVIVYYSRFGAIEALAEQVAAGVQRVPGAEATLLAVPDDPFLELQPTDPASTPDDERERHRTELLTRLMLADALVVGSPSYYGSMASPLKRFFEDCGTASNLTLDRTRPWHHYLFRDKPGAAFATSATPHGGNESTLQTILTMMMHLGMVIVTPGQRGPILEHRAAPYGPTAITGSSGRHELTAQEAEEARYLGQRVAEIASWLRDGRRAEVMRLQERLGVTTKAFDPSA